VEPSLDRLISDLNVRRQDLEIKWNAVAEQLRITPQHLYRIRQGISSVSDDVAARMDKFLLLPRGTVLARLRDQTSMPTETPPVEEDEFPPEEIARVRALSDADLLDEIQERRKASPDRVVLEWLRAVSRIRTEAGHPTPSDS